jgi:hypothetical protein
VGPVTIALWPVSVTAATFGQRYEHLPRPALCRNMSLASILVFLGLLVWLAAETRHGGTLGLAERVGVEVQTSWPARHRQASI